MADCSYARCIQERRSIKRELQRWTKNMVYVVGLERVAEELMGRRKWKLYQDVLLARDLPLHQSEENDSTQDQSASDTQDTSPPENNGSEREEQPMIATTEALQRNNSAADLTQDTTHDKEEKEAEKHIDPSSPIPVDEDSKEPKDTAAEDGTTPKEESNCTNNQQTTIKIKTIEEINTVSNETTRPTNTTETILESLIKRTSTGPPRPKPLPADWKPQDKCYFCVDGELVRPGVEQTSVPAPPEQPASPPTVGVESGSESGSSRSSPKTAQPRSTLPNLLGNQTHPNQGQQPLNPVQASFLQAQAFAHLLQLQQATRAAQQPSLNQVQAMAASLASIGALPNINPALALTLGSPAFLPHWYLQQQQRQQQQESRQPQEEQATPPPRSPAASSEMPLDLSAKPTSGPGTSNSTGTANQNPPSPSSLEARLAGLRGTPIDKQLFNRTKPRIAPTPGRRTYSETELQMALRDIQSGRLGTRRAAVIYNIPRSTLRNKVYKLEKERGARLPDQLSGAAPRVDDSNDNGEDLDDDKDSTIEEDREEERDPPRPVLSMEDVLRYSQMENPSYGQSEHLRALLGKGQKFFDMSSPKQDPPSETPWPLPDQSPMNAYIQQMILANAISAQLPKPEEANPTPMVPEIMRLFSDEHNNILKETLLKRDHMNNGKQSEEEMNKRHFSRQSSTASSVITKNDRATPRKTDSPEETPMDVDQTVDDSRDSPSNVILKIPSFKPVGPGSNSGKNGGEGFPGSGTPPLPYFSHSPHPEIPTGRPSDRLSPSKGIFMLRDVIAKSISQKFQQQSSVPNHNNDLRHLKVSSPGMDGMDGMNPFKRSNLTSPGGGQGISVIKNLTSHDLTRSFGSANAGLSNQQSNATGGKGTRPKRGKYRNYDRDSLVEAVKAVQRGEMSVHRAGSYYGVPHSTLEYKVKERHLMRPRKREPKNPNPDDKLPSPSVSSKPPDISNPGILRQDKSKILQKPPTKPNFPATSPNGMKMPNLFDGNLGLGYNPSPFPFWHPGAAFPGLNVDFQQRNPGAPGNFPPSSDPFFASQMMQKLQEESIRHPGLARKDSIGESSRDLPESTENNTNANGSFVENIIRSSLERQRPGGSEGDNETGDAVRRRIRPDDALLAEEMREAARRLRAREGVPPNLAMSPPASQAHPS